MSDLKTIKRYYHGDNAIEVSETKDHDYAYSCFEGTDKEWIDVDFEAQQNGGTYYIVSTGLAGLYMADTVYVYGNKEDALRDAKDTLERWQEEDADAEDRI